jgi:hypothetical protein
VPREPEICIPSYSGCYNKACRNSIVGPNGPLAFLILSLGKCLAWPPCEGVFDWVFRSSLATPPPPRPLVALLGSRLCRIPLESDMLY